MTSVIWTVWKPPFFCSKTCLNFEFGQVMLLKVVYDCCGWGSVTCSVLWLRKATLAVLMRGVTPTSERHGEIQGVEQWLLLRSHWSSSLMSSSAVGPPLFCMADNRNENIHNKIRAATDSRTVKCSIIVNCYWNYDSLNLAVTVKRCLVITQNSF